MQSSCLCVYEHVSVVSHWCPSGVPAVSKRWESMFLCGSFVVFLLQDSGRPVWDFPGKDPLNELLLGFRRPLFRFMRGFIWDFVIFPALALFTC